MYDTKPSYYLARPDYQQVVLKLECIVLLICTGRSMYHFVARFWVHGEACAELK